MKRFIVMFMLLSVFHGLNAQNATMQAIADDFRKNTDYWYDHTVILKTRDSVLNLYKSHLTDSNAVLLFRYYLSGIYELKKVSILGIDSAEALLNLHENRAVVRRSFYYSQLSSCYMYLGLLAQLKNNFGLAKSYYQRGLSECNRGLALKKEMTYPEGTRSLMEKKAFLLNNIGNLIYQSTNHKDPLAKRNEVGPLIEKYWVESDSISDSLLDSEKEICERNVSVKSNLLVLYGYYYPNEARAKYFYDQIIEHAQKCRDKKLFDKLNISLGWITFCREDYQGCIPYFVGYLKKYPNENSSYVQDARYALVESYYNLGMADSVLYYGNAYFQDTIYYKDYLFLSTSSTYMTEIYMQKGDTKMARELLRKSKEFMAESQHEGISQEYRMDGEEVMMTSTLNKISEISIDLESRDKEVLVLKIIVLVSLLLLSLVASIFLIKKLLALRLNHNNKS